MRRSFEIKTPRAICFDILNRIEGVDRHPDTLLTDSFKKYRYLTPIDRAFLTELTYGTLRWRGRLDWVISQLSRIPFEKIDQRTLNILRLGSYQILFLTKTPPSAAVNESVELAKGIRGKGGAGFVNGLLRSLVRRKEEISYPGRNQDPSLHLAVNQSHPIWLVRRWLEEIGFEEASRVCEGNNEISLPTLRVNSLRVDREQLILKLMGVGLNPKPTPFSEEGIVLRDSPPMSELPLLREGFYIIQDEASQLVTAILDPKPGERILDACAAPGGKTTHIAQRMENKGEIYALDLAKEKLNLIEEGCRRLGINIVKTLKGNAARPLPVLEGLEFDRVLADVPCSGFGTLRRNPDLKWKRTEGDIRRLSEFQSSILRNLSGYVKEGGVLTYSTCTVFHEENEDVVEKFLYDHPEFRLDPIDEVLPKKYHSLTKGGYFKSFPPRDQMDGFFAARMVKINKSQPRHHIPN